MRDVGKPRLFTKSTQANVYPDGLAVYSDGYVWCVHWHSGGASWLNPKLDFLQFFELPNPRVTSCTFWGSCYEQLYIKPLIWAWATHKCKCRRYLVQYLCSNLVSREGHREFFLVKEIWHWKVQSKIGRYVSKMRMELNGLGRAIIGLAKTLSETGVEVIARSWKQDYALS